MNLISAFKSQSASEKCLSSLKHFACCLSAPTPITNGAHIHCLWHELGNEPLTNLGRGQIKPLCCCENKSRKTYMHIPEKKEKSSTFVLYLKLLWWQIDWVHISLTSEWITASEYIRERAKSLHSLERLTPVSGFKNLVFSYSHINRIVWKQICRRWGEWIACPHSLLAGIISIL